MGGFAKLREDFDKWFPALDMSKIWKNDSSVDKQEQQVFRHLYLRCLFEIAGNLDTIALCARAGVEQRDKQSAESQQRFEGMLKQFQEMLDEFKKRNDPFPFPTMPANPEDFRMSDDLTKKLRKKAKE